MLWTQTWKKSVYTGEEHRNTKTKNKTAKRNISSFYINLRKNTTSRNRTDREANYYIRQENNKTIGKA